MQKLAAIFKVKPDEGRLVLLVGILFLCVQAGQGLADNAASALFFLRFGVDFLPYMYVLLGGTTVLLTTAYSAGLGRYERGRFFQGLLIGTGLLLALERLALARPFPLLYPIVWLTISCIGMILGTFVWNVAGEVSDARQAKRLFPLFTSAGILGSVAGNSITGPVAKWLGTENVLLLFGVLLGAAYFLTRSITTRYFQTRKPASTGTNFWSDVRAGYDFVRGSELMRLIAYASVLFSILFFAIAFPFNKVVTAAFPDEASVAGYLGLFNGITTAVTFLVSLLLANRVYSRLGIVNSVLLLPITYLFGFIVFAGMYSLSGGVIARSAQLVILFGVASTAWNALFNVVPSQKRGQVVAFQNGLPAQLGVALSGLLLILGERVLTTTQIFLMGIAVTLACGYLVWRMRKAYGDALLDALRAGRLEPESAGELLERVGLGDRGVLRPGMKADIAIWDADRILDTATFEKPHQYAQGVNFVFVNGVAVFEGGAMTAARPNHYGRHRLDGNRIGIQFEMPVSLENDIDFRLPLVVMNPGVGLDLADLGGLSGLVLEVEHCQFNFVQTGSCTGGPEVNVSSKIENANWSRQAFNQGRKECKSPYSKLRCRGPVR